MSASDAGRELGKLGASKGGKARAAKLSPEERSEIARNAVQARWGKTSTIPKATFGSSGKPLCIANIELPCYVLDDKRRVLNQVGMIGGLGMSHGGSGGRGGDRLAKFVSGKGINSFVSKELLDRTEKPIEFRLPNGTLAYGYEATILADICEAVLAARRAGALQKQQLHIADRCEILVRGFARVGIIALVDEATGYQEVRDQQALQLILDQYLRKEFAAWAKQFPEPFYREIFRLRGWQWRGMKVNRPSAVAHYTKDLVYRRLAPNLLDELERLNPVLENGSRRVKHHQWLTDNIGMPALAQHLHAVVALMRSSDTWSDFLRSINRAFPRRTDSLQHPLFHNMDADESEVN